MPYRIERRGNEYCVIGPNRIHGCHDSRAEAIKQQRALYRAEGMSAEGSIVSDMSNGFSQRWEGVLGLEGEPTGDKRYLIPGEIGERDLPLPFNVQLKTAEGHQESVNAGAIDRLAHIPVSEFERGEDFALEGISESAIVIWGEGYLDDSEAASEAVRMIENGYGVSLDLPRDRTAAFNPETLEEVAMDEVDPFDLLAGLYLEGIAGKICGVTVVNIAAFEDAKVRFVKEEVLVASASSLRLVVPALTASAAGIAPLKPPREWFEIPEAHAPTPLTVTEDGRVFGHLALWNQCHTAFGECEMPNRSNSGYAYFHTGQIETAEGEMVNVGRITVERAGAAKGGHASLILGTQGAMEHYVSTGCVGAFVRAKDGQLGIWLSGSVRSDAPAERVRDMRANPPSLDYRWESKSGCRELIAALSVPVGGFPIPRYEAHVVASGGVEEVRSLIAVGYVPEEAPDRGYLRKVSVLASRAREALTA